MIFEFLKKLFWKADEGNRKRKLDECSFSDLHAKRYCTSLGSRMRINHNSTDNLNTESMTMDHPNGTFKIKDLNGSKNEAVNKLNIQQIGQSKLMPVSKIDFKHDKFLKQKNTYFEKTADEVTLNTTYRLAEKKQYSEMLANFTPPKIYLNSETSRKAIDYDNLFKNINFNENETLLDSKYNNSGSKCIYSPMLQSSDTSIIQCQKCFSVSKLDIKDKNCSKLYIRTPVDIIKTNSLKDELSAKKVFKHDFIFQVAKKYSERIEQSKKEVQELEKVTHALSKHNQLLRETVLEEQLSHSMKLCKVFLDEREIEEESKLPELTTEMKKCIDTALTIGPSDEILVQSFGLSITRKDIQTLAGLNWLNDEIINFYMNLLIKRGENKNYPRVYAMNTFFYPKLSTGGHASLKRWTRKIDIFSKDIVVIPIHLGIHWCMSIIDFRNKSIKYYDSMGSPNHKCLQLLKQYLYDESIDKKKIPFNFQNWIFECIKDIPQQMNGSDCGVFSCMFAEYICANKTLNFSQDDMPYFRNKMIYEILTVKLL